MLQSENRNKTTVCKSTGDAVARELIDFSFPTRYSAAYAAEIDHFVNVMSGDPSCVSKNDVLLVSLVASACEESHRTGKVMKIDEGALTFTPL